MSRKAYFNEIANIWDEKYCSSTLATFLEELVPKFGLKPGQNILDLGTGTGVLIPFLLSVVGSSGSITAVDYAEKMVEVCRSKYSRFQNVKVVLQDVKELDFPPESFDVVTCFGLFPHLENRDNALYTMNRVLKPGGKLIIAHALSSAEIKDHHSSASSVVIYDELPEESEMRQLLMNAGFVEYIIEDKPGCYLCMATKPLRKI